MFELLKGLNRSDKKPFILKLVSPKTIFRNENSNKNFIFIKELTSLNEKEFSALPKQIQHHTLLEII